MLCRSITEHVDPGVFDAYEWSPPGTLCLHRSEALDRVKPVTSDNPAGMVFVLRHPERDALPRELGAVHLPGLLPDDCWVLAPWGIDDATDWLYAARRPAEEALELATDSLAGVFWGLHDWAHFHSHGPFERVAETEMQCDTAALVWLWDNLAAVDATPAHWQRIFDEVRGLWRQRFAEEARLFDEAPALKVLREAGLPVA